MMNLEEIKALMQEFDQSGIHKMSLEIENLSLKLEKETMINKMMKVAPPTLAPAEPVVAMAAEGPSAVAVTAVPAQEPVQENAGEVPVKSPVVGTFYQASAPDAAPFVTVGQRVQKGQTLCIIEAMKMMNEIAAPVSGEVVKILVNQEDMVEYDQTIMLIKEG